ncbi:DUF1611 domain-containing protein [Clostridium perfringens]|uniref:S8 family peptidase n=1 Tax=Clostridium perfringens TaxID=1502 RepID=UPI0018E4B509|nr:DUF1611 domain-containing protein [Clostridium perfringens]MBI5978593.1 DUF1611 domain-containing protein [Clostridium perfringens]MBI5981519.1 DUF1611 domain-containing protein [Clostridium perfringens]MBI6042889.1 DUF1611 domain-containing protein [Clostridium perfringens]MBI6060837.1 DUF1611 domain-containing protein [Clostridium perfringens]MBI6077855.1 DUF1611 domain-containing protein [Clostridium perfringens]
MIPKILIIDSGITHFEKDNTSVGFSFLNNNIGNNLKDNIGHGTAVNYIIKKYGHSEIINVKIFDDIDDNIVEDNLISLLNYIYINIDVDIIHMSIGITLCTRKKDLEDICEKLSNKGVIIVSAFSNDGNISYPAAFKSVIGVDISSRCKKVTDWEFVESDIINIRGMSCQQNLPWINGEFKLLAGSSFVAPHITGIISNLMASGVSNKNEIFSHIRKISKKIHPRKSYNIQEQVFNINKAVIFPFNKEMHSLVRFQNLLNFQITDVLDLKYMKTINKKSSEILQGQLENDFIIKNIENLNWNNNFDTFIIGHVREINEVIKKDFRRVILEKCLYHGKNVYSLDDLSSYTDLLEKFKFKNLNVYYPRIVKENAPNNMFGKLFSTITPAIGVFGTSSKQGKFTLQLKLKELFMKKGYKVGQLGTEPTSALFGCDFTYPMGYDGIIETNSLESIAIINEALNHMDEKDYDVIITGSQSQSVPYALYNLSFLPIEQHNFLLGIAPEIIVLCVNAYDDYDYIERTIKYLEGIVDTLVIGVVLSPIVRTLDFSNLSRTIKIMNNDELIDYRDRLTKHINKDVYLLNASDEISKLVDNCINYLSN